MIDQKCGLKMSAVEVTVPKEFLAESYLRRLFTVSPAWPTSTSVQRIRSIVTSILVRISLQDCYSCFHDNLPTATTHF